MAKIGRLLLLAVLVVGVAISAGMLIPRPLWRASAAVDAPATHRILVLSNPIHTDIAIPIDASVRARFPFLEEAGVPASHPDARWMVFGWGSRAFYLETPTWSQLKPLPVLKALTIDRSVMRVDVAGEISELHPAVTGFEVDDAAFGRLLEFIGGSFVEGQGGPVVIPGAGYGSNDRFFEAKGYFNALVGCNTWTARALREAGLTTGLWNPLPVTLSASLGIHN